MKQIKIYLILALISSITPNPKKIKTDRALENPLQNTPQTPTSKEDYFRLMINHHVPYYQGGWGPYNIYKPLGMTPPIQTMMVNNASPPAPKTVMPSDIKGKTLYNVHTYPHHMSSPFNLHSFFNVYNPNTSQITSSSPLHSAALGMHPFSTTGMVSPFMNPYSMMNPMMMGAYGMGNSISGMGVPGMGPQASAFSGGLGSMGNGNGGGMQRKMQGQVQGQMQGMMPGQMQGMMPGQMQGMMPGQMQGMMQGRGRKLGGDEKNRDVKNKRVI